MDTATPGTISGPGAALAENDLTAARRRIPSTGLRAAVGVRRPTGQPMVRIRWYQRLRSGALLVLLTIGFGMAIGGVVGLAALIGSFVLG